MNKNRVQDLSNEVKVKEEGDKVNGDKSREYKDKAGKQDGKSGAVLGDVNGEPGKESK